MQKAELFLEIIVTRYEAPSLLSLVILTPIVFFLEAQDLSDFAIAQRRLKLAHLTGDGRVWARLLQILLSWNRSSNGIVRGIENLKAQAILLDAQIADLTQVAGIYVRPCITLSGLWFADDVGKVSLVLVGLDHVANAKDIDVAVVETAGEGSCRLLTADFGERVSVHGVNIVIFLQRESVVVGVALREADSIGGFGARDDDLGYTEFASSFNDIVGRCYVASEALIVWNQHVACIGCKVDDHVWRLRHLWFVITSKVVVGGEGVVDLTAVGEVGLEREDVVFGSREIDQVQVEDLVALLDELWYGVSASLTRTTSEYDAFS